MLLLPFETFAQAWLARGGLLGLDGPEETEDDSSSHGHEHYEAESHFHDGDGGGHGH